MTSSKHDICYMIYPCSVAFITASMIIYSNGLMTLGGKMMHVSSGKGVLLNVRRSGPLPWVLRKVKGVVFLIPFNKNRD